jgi:hypothetical protein
MAVFERSAGEERPSEQSKVGRTKRQQKNYDFGTSAIPTNFTKSCESGMKVKLLLE